jgi:hypothetical protein
VLLAGHQRSSCRRGLRVLLVGELGSVELSVEAVLGQQTGVGAPLNDAAIVDDQKLIGLAYGGKSVSDDEGRAPAQGLA